MQVITEQFHANYIPEKIHVNTVLTDAFGNNNMHLDKLTSNIADGVAPTPYVLYEGYIPRDDPEIAFDEYYRTIIFNEPLDTTEYASDTLPNHVIALYNTSNLPLPLDDVDKTLDLPDRNPRILLISHDGYPSNFNTLLFVVINGSLHDLSGNPIKLGTKLYRQNNEIPQLTSASIKDDSTIALTFDKAINFSTVSIQDFTVNATIAISDVLTRVNTIYLTTDPTRLTRYDSPGKSVSVVRYMVFTRVKTSDIAIVAFTVKSWIDTVEKFIALSNVNAIVLSSLMLALVSCGISLFCRYNLVPNFIGLPLRSCSEPFITTNNNVLKLLGYPS